MPEAVPSPALQDRCVLVTGASSGIGAGVAQAMAEAGAAVALNYHSNAEGAETLARRICEAGGRAVALKADVSKEDEVEGLMQQTIEAFGRLDILVANSGLQRDAPVAEMSLAQWQAVLDTNLTGQFLCARAAVKQFRQQPRPEGPRRARGTIVHMSSVHQQIPWAGHVNYAASKGGLDMLMRSLAQELAPEGIRVNAIAPGAIATAINREATEDPAARERLLRLIPWGRVGEAQDVARAAVWLASDAADYVVGTTLFVDGGMSLYPEFRDNG